jgi:hypothetical protein
VADTAHHLPLAQWSRPIHGYPIPLELRPTIPAVAGVYVFLTRDGNVAYVGQTADPPVPRSDCGLLGRITNHASMRLYQRDPQYGDLGGVCWLEMPGSTYQQRRDLEGLLEDHYVPYWNKSDKDRVGWAKKLGLDPDNWPPPRRWHGAAVDRACTCPPILREAR